MAENRKKNYWRSIAAGIVILIFILSVGMTWVISEYTFVNYYVWFSLLVAGGIVSAWPCRDFWKWLTGVDSLKARLAVHTVFFAVFVSGLLLGLNYLLADRENLPVENVAVVRKYSETHHRTRRVGRRVTARGEPYYIYKVEVEIADGRHREFQVPLSRYNRLKSGSEIEMHKGPGALGFPVISL